MGHPLVMTHALALDIRRTDTEAFASIPIAAPSPDELPRMLDRLLPGLLSARRSTA
jgi:hypothetical protein